MARQVPDGQRLLAHCAPTTHDEPAGRLVARQVPPGQRPLEQSVSSKQAEPAGRPASAPERNNV